MYALPVAGGSQFTLRKTINHYKKFKNEDGMLARWYLLLGQFQLHLNTTRGLHNNADGMSCGQLGDPTVVSAADIAVSNAQNGRSAVCDIGNGRLMDGICYRQGRRWHRHYWMNQ